jgi:hypothetical protein
MLFQNKNMSSLQNTGTLCFAEVKTLTALITDK